jgi:Ca2+-binding RTX toxin-like protein
LYEVTERLVNGVLIDYNPNIANNIPAYFGDCVNGNGYTDGKNAYNIALNFYSQIPQISGSAIYFGIDADTAHNLNYLTDVINYFQGINRAFNDLSDGTPLFKIGVYGCGDVLDEIYGAGLAQYKWLASASDWAGSSGYADYNIKQGLQDTTTFSGVKVDPDVTNGSDFGEWGPLQTLDTPPSATGHDQSVSVDATIALSTLFSYSDPDAGDSVTMFAVKDRTTGAGYLTKNGVQQAENTLFDSIPISQISQWAFVASASDADSIGFNAYDSHGSFSPSATAVVTTATTVIDNPPSATGHDQSVSFGTTIALSTLFSYSDPDAVDSVTMFAFKDRTTGAGYLTKNGVQQAENTLFDSIPIGQISQWAFVASTSGADSIGFNAYDSHGSFSPSATAIVTTSPPPDNPPSASGHDQSVSVGTTIALSTLFSYSDPDAGDSVTMFAVKDRTTGAGYLTKNGVQQAENTLFDSIPIGQISQWAFVADTSGATDSIGFNAYDSQGSFSPSATAVVTTQANILIGTNDDDILTGSAGNDTLYGLGGNDTLYGLEGNDTLSGGPGVDTMVGGAGDDVYNVDNAADQVIEAVGGGTDRVLASVSYILHPGQEIEQIETGNIAGTTVINFEGNEFANKIYGNAANNVLAGDAGDDSPYGFAGNDTLSGGTGNDSLTGGAG